MAERERRGLRVPVMGREKDRTGGRERERASCVYFQSCWLPDDSRYGSASGCCPSFLFYYSPSFPFAATALSVCHTPRVFKISHATPTTYIQRVPDLFSPVKEKTVGRWKSCERDICREKFVLKIQVNCFIRDDSNMRWFSLFVYWRHTYIVRITFSFLLFFFFFF